MGRTLSWAWSPVVLGQKYREPFCQLREALGVETSKRLPPGGVNMTSAADDFFDEGACVEDLATP